MKAVSQSTIVSVFATPTPEVRATWTNDHGLVFRLDLGGSTRVTMFGLDAAEKVLHELETAVQDYHVSQAANDPQRALDEARAHADDTNTAYADEAPYTGGGVV